MSASPKLGSWIAGGNSTPGRRDGDFYPSPPEITEALLRAEDFGSEVWEPAAGDGAMVDVLRQHGYAVTATDLTPRRGDIAQQDFLRSNRLLAPVIFTNPPFNQAEAFIRHGHRLGADALALVLKATYWHATSRSDLFAQHRPAVVYALTWRPDFLNKGAPTMDVVWCVWRRSFLGETVYRLLSRPCMPAPSEPVALQGRDAESLLIEELLS